MKKICQLRWRFGRTQNGQTMAEYALIVALVAIAALAGWQFLGGHISSAVTAIGGQV